MTSLIEGENVEFEPTHSKSNPYFKYLDTNTITYDVWNFVLLVSEPMFRPLVYLTFYLTFLLDNDNVF